MSQSFGPSDDTESLATLKHAVDIGCTFWDTAVVYGRGHNETLLGRFFAANPSAREKVFVGSKCGFDCLGSDGETPTSSAAGATTSPNEVTNKPEHIRAYIEASRKRMGSYPDLYYLHRIDPDTPIEESVAALDEVRKQGKTRYIGLSECSEATLRRACKGECGVTDGQEERYGAFTTPIHTALLYITLHWFASQAHSKQLPRSTPCRSNTRPGRLVTLERA